jgi:TIR domain-containing protein
MSRFFISYRREDGSGYAGRIYDHLVQNFGEDHVFMDVDAIEPGQDFVEVIQSAVGSCSALIAVIGRNWSGARPDGSRRIDDPEDFVHLEVATALERGVRVIPVLVDDAEVPKSAELPPRLQALARRNAVQATHTSFRAEIERLVRTLAKIEAPAAAGGPPSPPVAVASPKPPPRPAEVARVSRLDIPEDIYGGFFLSPDGRDLYLSRLREKIDSSERYDLLHFDLEAGGLTRLADVGSDGAYYAGFLGGLFYKTQAVESYKTSRILCFRRGTSVPDPIGERIVQNFNVSGGGKLIFKKRDQYFEWEFLLGHGIRLNLGEDAKWVAWSHPRKPLLLVKFSLPSEEKPPLYEYRLLELDPFHNARSSRSVLVESKARRFDRFTSWTDDRLLFVERFDSNGDGKVDPTDDRNELVRALDLRNGEISQVFPESSNRTGLGGHPSGEHVYSLEEIAKNEKYVLRVVDLRASRSTDLAVLEGGRYYCEFDSACRLAICQRVADSSGEKQFYSWEDRSSIYRIDLPALG